DNLYLGKGQLAPSNASLVSKIRHILEELSYDIASADEARAMLETKGASSVKF
ncbi:MAG: 3-keto-5-aminohexanoate cleavage protein, partial [Alphaproteobacteria bacterium]|nr:3-keto-5-aminohexanoate cleavage protein [Alphaproteobacteria bacterium]